MRCSALRRARGSGKTGLNVRSARAAGKNYPAFRAWAFYPRSGNGIYVDQANPTVQHYAQSEKYREEIQRLRERPDFVAEVQRQREERECNGNGSR
jgi:hypothetical protein